MVTSQKLLETDLCRSSQGSFYERQCEFGIYVFRVLGVKKFKMLEGLSPSF